MLRINPDGTHPRPTTPSSPRPPGVNRAIWALGLRNPFTFAFQPGTGRMFINDVGAEHAGRRSTRAVAGANYGWPDDRRTDDEPGVRRAALSPTHHGSATTAARSRAAPSTTRRRGNFPASTSGDYFFADYCGGWIRPLDPSAATRWPTSPRGICAARSISQVGADGSLLLPGARGRRARLARSRYSGSPAPSITHQPAEPDHHHRSCPSRSPSRPPATRAAQLSVAAQQRQHPRCDGVQLHALPLRRLTTTARTFRCHPPACRIVWQPPKRRDGPAFP